MKAEKQSEERYKYLSSHANQDAVLSLKYPEEDFASEVNRKVITNYKR